MTTHHTRRIPEIALGFMSAAYATAMVCAQPVTASDAVVVVSGALVVASAGLASV